ncbi:hypothetical protein BKA70DRAFT_1537916 [Coprinopsis sp. MPI-PUGE-AT-0042]|nr:hypothetical protein BKA70DRAFT_1537916 [Coprinopsis sp. MPI-PUGE-AT-0042]
MGAAFSTWARWDDTVVQQVLATEAPPIQSSGPTFHQNAQGTQNFAAPISGGTFIQNNQQDPSEHLRKVLDFLSLVNFRTIQQENLGKWTPGTVKWLLRSSMFQLWLETQNAILWGTGMPGAGKTVLASVAIEHLQELADASTDICVTFVYCRYTEPMKVRDILAALVRQLLERHPHLLSMVEPMYAKHDLEKTKPTQAELINIIRDIYSRFRIAFLFIDGLDEALYDEQFDLLDTLKSVRANVFITSRPLVTLKDVLPNVEFFDIAAKGEDIELLVSQHINRSPNLQQVLAVDGQRELVIKKICESSRGMFLHASLMVEAVRHCTNSRHVMEKLEKLPAKLDALYDEAFERIEMQPEEHTALAKRWRAIQVLTGKLQKNLVPESLMVSVCCGLVVFEEKEIFEWDWTDGAFDPHIHTARLVHYTALDAVKHVFERWQTPPHCLLTEVCMERLIICGIPSWQTRDGLELILQSKPPLQSYAYKSWYLHAADSIQCPAQPNARPVASILRFLSMCSAFPVFDLIDIGGRPVFDRFTAPIHLITYYHLPALLPIVGSQVNKRTRGGRSALTLAAWRNDTVMAELLLKLDGIDVNLQDKAGNTALIVAAWRKDAAMAGLLLNLDGIDVNLQDKDGNTALIVAARRNDAAMAGLLLNLDGIDVNLQDNDGNTALMIAAMMGSAEMVESLLLNPRIDTNKRNKWGQTALNCALYSAYKNRDAEAAWRLFEAPGIDIDAADADGRTPRLALSIMGLPDSITRGPDVKSALEEQWFVLAWRYQNLGSNHVRTCEEHYCD